MDTLLLNHPGVVSSVESVQLDATGVVSSVESVQLDATGASVEKADAGSFILSVR
jgi:hypothetical protein